MMDSQVAVYLCQLGTVTWRKTKQGRGLDKLWGSILNGLVKGGLAEGVPSVCVCWITEEMKE